MKSLLITTAVAAALTNSTAEAAKVQRVTFDSHHEKIVGNLYLPDNYQDGSKLPGIVVTGAWTTVKEQMPAIYAKALASHGFATLTFDFGNWGESGGKERQLENPKNKSDDIVAAADFLATRAEVDAGRVGGLGICASSGYMVNAAIQSNTLRSVVLVAPWLHNGEMVETIYGGAAHVRSLIATSREAEAQFRRTGKLTLIPAASTTDEKALMFKAPYYTEPARGMIPAWRNEFNLASWEDWLTFDSVALADQMNKPLLIVESEAAAVPQGAHAFYTRLHGPKEQLWLDDVTQFDFYDQPQAVATATEAATNHFMATLTRTDAQEQSALQTVVTSVATLADRRDFENLEKLFADPVTVDYTSAFGGQVEQKTPQSLMAAWAGLLPGFDRTHHAISNIRPQVNDNIASATADVTADHWIAGQHWQVVGSYDYRFAKTQDDWKVSAITFHLKSESGSRDVLPLAAKRAAAHPVSYIEHPKF